MLDIFLEPIPRDYFSNFGDVNTTMPDLKNSTSSQTHILVYKIIMPIAGLVAILMNLTVVVSSGFILKSRPEPRSTYLFLGNIALSDLVNSFAILFGQFFPRDVRNHEVCAFQIGLIVSSAVTSIYSVGLIAIDRFLYIVHGIKYVKYITTTRTRFLIVFSWIIGGLIGYLPLMGWSSNTDNGRICWFIIVAPKGLILLTVVVGIIPIFTVIVLYTIILYHALKKVGELQKSEETREVVPETNTSLRFFRGNNSISSNSSGVSNAPSKLVVGNIRKSPTKWKAIKVVVYTSGSFTIMWFPYFIACVIYAFCTDKNSEHCKFVSVLIANPLAILGFCNNLVDPIIYAWWHKGFRSLTKIRLNRMMLKSSTVSITEMFSFGSSMGSSARNVENHDVTN